MGEKESVLFLFGLAWERQLWVKCLGSRHIEPLVGRKFSNNFHDVFLSLPVWFKVVRSRGVWFFDFEFEIDNKLLKVDQFFQKY